MDRPIYFTVGPVEMYEETLAIEALQTPYERMPEFSEMYLETEGFIKELAFAGKDAKVVMLTASGTGAMEALVMNALTENDKALLINGGTFGRYFEKILNCHGITYDAVKLDFNETLDYGHLAKYEGGGYAALLVNIHETGTGQLYDAELLAGFCRRNGMFFLVDAISSFCADMINIEELGIDALIFSSQKALALSPGISVVVLSNRLYESRIAGSGAPSVYFDFNDYIENGKRGQTPYTAAIKTVYAMREALARFKLRGIENVVADTRRLADKFRADLRARDWPVYLPAYPMSNALTTLIFQGADAEDVFKRLRDEYGFVVTPSGGDFAARLLRIGHIGNMKAEYYDSLLDAMGEILA